MLSFCVTKVILISLPISHMRLCDFARYKYLRVAENTHRRFFHSSDDILIVKSEYLAGYFSFLLTLP